MVHTFHPGHVAVIHTLHTGHFGMVHTFHPGHVAVIHTFHAAHVSHGQSGSFTQLWHLGYHAGFSRKGSPGIA